ncbi:MAG: hypothetical protein JNL83_30090, partial [Myxococcales bacterium]|nr:hypothetical protein [Myxococcales bacterium]
AAELAEALHHAFAGTLSDALRQRGALLERDGAWATGKPRASTSRLRPRRS